MVTKLTQGATKPTQMAIKLTQRAANPPQFF
jgi:hypothetical protein